MDFHKYARELTDLALRIEEETDCDVFIRYSGHVKWISIDVHVGGWVEDIPADYRGTFTKHDTEEEFEEIVTSLEYILEG